jgi:ATP-dependent Lon protease
VATALISALTHAPIRHDVAMTGEITIRGRVLEIGGLKEKSMAAYTNGIRTVIIPQANQKDITELTPVVQKNVEFIRWTVWTRSYRSPSCPVIKKAPPPGAAPHGTEQGYSIRQYKPPVIRQ